MRISSKFIERSQKIMGFIDTIKARAKADKKTIVLPESEDRRTYEAAAQILKEDLANLIIIGSEEAVKKGSEGLDVSKATIVDPEKNEKTQAYVDKLVELRAKKGMTPEKARETILNDYTYYGVMMVKMGDADGLVSGACHSTANTLRPCLQILKTKPGTKLVSAFFLMVVPDCEYGDDGADTVSPFEEYFFDFTAHFAVSDDRCFHWLKGILRYIIANIAIRRRNKK